VEFFCCASAPRLRYVSAKFSGTARLSGSASFSACLPIPIPNAAGWKERLISRKELCGRSPDYESIVFSRKPLFELRGGPIFFGFAVLLRLIFVFFSFRFLAINCSLDFILNNTVGNYSTATRASF
jgi:hypothetical protein